LSTPLLNLAESTIGIQLVEAAHSLVLFPAHGHAAQLGSPLCAWTPETPCCPRCAQSLYADLSGNVLLHASVPALGLRAEQWAIVSWGHTHAQLPDFADSRFTYRCACCAVLLPSWTFTCSTSCSIRP
jgi:hypothetical protein